MSELAKFQATPGLEIPEPPPLPSFSLVPPPARVTVRPTYNFANMDSSGDEDSDADEAMDREAANQEASENATAVTRFLIKHLPKQLAKLRHDKGELEEKIRDLETLISNQNVAMTEMERRIDIFKKEAETARKWSASLANLHHMKVNNLASTAASNDPVVASMASELKMEVELRPQFDQIELPVTVTRGNVKMLWKILCSASNTLGFVAYRASTSSFVDSIPTYIQSNIPLHPNDYSEIEVKAQEPGLYVMQLRASR